MREPRRSSRKCKPSSSRSTYHSASRVAQWIADHLSDILQAVKTSVPLGVLLAYAIVLVGLAGQTLGMMVCDVRVVDLRDGRASLRGAFTRYAAGIGSLLVLIGFCAIFRRVQPFERRSRTRLVVGYALPERSLPRDLRERSRLRYGPHGGRSESRTRCLRHGGWPGDRSSQSPPRVRRGSRRRMRSPAPCGYERPTISPSSSRSMRRAAGLAPRPGMVRISPQIG